MVSAQSSKWFCAIAGSGVVLGIVNYFQSEKECVQTSWTTNFTPAVKWDDNWDRRKLSSIIKPAKKENDPSEQNRINEEKLKLKPTATRHLILIRHGQYDLSGKTDSERRLTPLGQKQAEITGLRLKDLKLNYTNLIHSTMTRAIETAGIIHKFLPKVPIESCNLIEEGLPVPTEPRVGKWRPEMIFNEEGARIEAAFRKHFHRADASQKSDSFEIIVGHANVIRYFICRVLQFPPEAWQRFYIHHCSLTVVAIRPSGRVIVYSIGDSGHIPKDKMTIM